LEGQAEFYAGKAEDIIKNTDMNEGFFLGDDVIIVDPPREGLHNSVIDFLSALRKRQSFKLLYISCNPLTFARDLSLL
jgi:23S rRNA (uracil1939-C5)-methyltransferase